MDFEKRLLAGVRNKAEYEEAIATLRAGYATAVEGTEWAEAFADAKARAIDDAGPPDWLSLSEIEDRGVASVWPKEGLGRAWVWRHPEWREAPGLLTKPGYALGRYQFRREFPDADLDALFRLIKDFLGDEEFNSRRDPPVDSRFERDQFIMSEGYQATLRQLKNGPPDFPSVFQEVHRGLDCGYSRLRPYVARWYRDGVEQHGPFRHVTAPADVTSILQCLDSVLAEAYRNEALKAERRADDDIFVKFLWQLPQAIGAFAANELERLAKKVRYTLRRNRASGIFGVSGHASQWHEFCYHAHFGPPELDLAFESLVDPLIAARTDELPRPILVLLTMDRQWESEELEHQDGDTIAPDSVRSGILNALRRLALESECPSYDD